MAIRWDKFTVKAQEAVQRANEIASEHGNPELMPLHVLAALLEDREGIVPPILEKIGMGPQAVLNDVYSEIEKLPKVSGSGAQQPTQDGGGVFRAIETLHREPVQQDVQNNREKALVPAVGPEQGQVAVDREDCRNEGRCDEDRQRDIERRAAQPEPSPDRHEPEGHEERDDDQPSCHQLWQEVRLGRGRRHRQRQGDGGRYHQPPSNPGSRDDRRRVTRGSPPECGLPG